MIRPPDCDGSAIKSQPPCQPWSLLVHYDFELVGGSVAARAYSSSSANSVASATQSTSTHYDSVHELKWLKLENVAKKVGKLATDRHLFCVQIHMKTMQTSVFRLLTGQDTPHYI